MAVWTYQEDPQPCGPFSFIRDFYVYVMCVQNIHMIIHINIHIIMCTFSTHKTCTYCGNSGQSASVSKYDKLC